MKRITAISLLGLCLPLSAAAADLTQFTGRLIGNSEVPSISTAASGRFRAYVASDGLHYELIYSGLEGGAVTQAHIHLGERHTNGGIVIWLCSNLASPPTPAGVQACPAPPARIVGIATASNVVGPAGQGIDPGEFAALIKALGNGTAYTNVHTTSFPGGEIRASILRTAP
jgi:CHRD domain